ncbi:hypothetical protein BDV29DRAFT_88558 [Aspergillus leporis]|uniref:Uncharacterized protein n=1 Tax=Aspergillus leporis TaxID=41062 RepID=A0A5N5WIC4_9EURO|nr:hypothetical protein BDV29DRAFT_88558 [Aspergillus leporis]
MKGSAEIWSRDSTNNLAVDKMKIFPAPGPLPNADRIKFTKYQLFGPLIPVQEPNHSPPPGNFEITRDR